MANRHFGGKCAENLPMADHINHDRAGLLKAVELGKHAPNDPGHLHVVFVAQGQHLARDHIAPAPAQRRAVVAKERLSREWCHESSSKAAQ